MCINILTITIKITQCPRGEIGRHKGLKILALLGVPVRVWPRAPKLKMEKESILLIFKDKKKITKNQDFWKDKFLKRYYVHDLYLYDFIDLTNKKIIELINKKIIELKIKIVLIEGDHLALIDYHFVSSINDKVKKGLFLGDDSEWHQVNLITASACDFVLTDPVSVLKFNELGISSIFSPIEANDEVFKNYNYKKEIDVLFFGRDKTDRKDYLRILDENNIKYLSVNPYLEISNTIEKLAKLINKSKIVINLTKSLNGKRFYNPLSKYKYGYYMKGRVIMTGLCNSLCISENAPANNILYPNKEIPIFKSKEEFLDIVKFFLNNADKLKSATKNFHESTLKYSDKNYIDTLYTFINSVKKKQESIEVKIPFWYFSISIRQHYRLRSKFNKLKTFFNQFLDNLNMPIYLLPINVFFFFRYILIIILKTILNKKND